MSDEKDEAVNNDEDEVYTPTRAELKSDLGISLKAVREKCRTGRIYDKETSKIRVQWHRCLAYLVQQYNSLLNSEWRDDVEERLKELEEEL